MCVASETPNSEHNIDSCDIASGVELNATKYKVSLKRNSALEARKWHSFLLQQFTSLSHYTAFVEFVRAVVAEFTGTMFLMLFGTLILLIHNGPNLVYVAGVSWSGLAIALIYTFRGLSGAHFNPAATLAIKIVDREFTWRRVYWFISAQVSGGLIGTALAVVLAPNVPHVGQTTLGNGVTIGQGLLAEALATFFLVTVAFLVNHPQHGNSTISPLVIGCAVLANVVWCGPLTGISMNPARSIGPAIMSAFIGQGESGLTSTKPLQQLWIYLVAPTAGAVFAAFFYFVLTMKLPQKEQARSDTPIAKPEVTPDVSMTL